MNTSEEVFYLVCLKQFGNFPIKAVKKPLKVRRLLEEALKEGESLDPEQSLDGSVSELTEVNFEKIVKGMIYLNRNVSERFQISRIR